ncbi:hypothetical protein FGO68_gene10673 [Halteria grandinella]|uniref:Uncharacterized protein n=1 Tax=Halteria grandinella TaxID=5974 RepID=A0A8J8NC49_HALGN|nr:hypothetical protein FGO68_gene10673 [Halteria grandinella]
MPPFRPYTHQLPCLHYVWLLCIESSQIAASNPHLKWLPLYFPDRLWICTCPQGFRGPNSHGSWICSLQASY